MVWVTPGMLPARMMVAPNSPRLRANMSVMPANTALPESGRVTVKKASQPLAPRVRAARQKAGSMDSMPRRIERTSRGKPTTEEAMMAPVRVKITWMSYSMSQEPRKPRRPNSTSSR